MLYCLSRQENWPRGPAPGPAHTATSQGASNQTRLPSAPLTLHPLSCSWVLRAQVWNPQQFPSWITLSTAGQVRGGKFQRKAKKEARKARGESGTGLPERLYQVVSGITLGEAGFWEGIFPLPSPEPVPHGTGALAQITADLKVAFLAESGFTKGRRCPHQAGAGGSWALPLRRGKARPHMGSRNPG